MRPVTSPITGVRSSLQSNVPAALSWHADAPIRRAWPDRCNFREAEPPGICYTHC